MECNKSEALRAMEMAEQKFKLQDYAAARKLALKAQQLFPSLENVAQMIAVIDVHAAAQTRIGINEKDWYGILQVEPSADDSIVKKQYRKLALFLHPDKNKAVGAESAFKLIGEALQVLSDKVKRLVYDAKRGMHMHAKVKDPFHGSSQASGVVNGWQKSSFFFSSPPPPPPQQQHHHQQQKTYTDVGAHSHNTNKTSQYHFQQPPPSPSSSAASGQPHNFHLLTFWTACTSCQMRYQYYRKYENQNLLCPQCRKPFIAKDLSAMPRINVLQAWPPQTGGIYNAAGTQPRQANMSFSTNYKSNPSLFANYSSSSFNYFSSSACGSRSDTFQMFSGATSHANGTGTAPSVHTTTNFPHVTGTRYDDAARKLEEYYREKELAKERKQQWKNFLATERSQMFSQPMMRRQNSSGSASNIQEVLSAKRAKAEIETGTLREDAEAAEVNRKLAKLGRDIIRKKLNLRVAKPNVPSFSLRFSFGEKHILFEKRESCESPSIVVHAPPKRKAHERQEHTDKKPEKKLKVEEMAASCAVPDADFYNFDEGREEKDVEVGQIWALYDDRDSMPKYYMKVREVHSRSPFKVSIGWFEIRKPSDEVCDLLDMGFSIGCGEFRVSSSQVMKSVNSFSHLVSWERSGKGLVKIYPKKGQVWCVYKDWRPGQLVVEVGDKALNYRVVEVLTDCDEMSGAVVMLLNKVEGFKSIFQLSNDPVMKVPFLELLRFSHRVPARKLKGDEAPGIPKDCWELDPAAVPLSLIHPDVKAGTS